MARIVNHIFLVLLAVTLLASLCLGQAANATQPSQASAQAAPSAAATPPSSAKGHGVMPVELAKSLDSTKLKEGDPVMARIAAELHMKDGTEIPRGSKVTGHVTEAKSRSKGDPQSALGIIFDKISLPDHKEMAIKGEIQAMAPNPNATEADSGGVNYTSMSPGKSGGGMTAPPMSNSPTSVQAGRPILNAESKGVIGMHNLELGENSVLLSHGKSVRLDSGTQMIVQVDIE